MVNARTFAISVGWVLLWTSLVYAQDLSRYREFQLGMNRHAVADKIDARPSEVKVIHRRPALIQELEWRPRGSLASSREAESVRVVVFTFFNGELCRMVISYDPDRTQGLTDRDMIEAVSATYGIATEAAAETSLFPSTSLYSDQERVVARWEDLQSSVTLFRSSSLPRFGVLILSKRLDALAQASNLKASRLDELEAPQREIARRKMEAEEARAARAKARPVNKADFRP